MNVFKTKKIKADLTLGEILHQARLVREITLEEAERKTKIKIAYLEALEQNDYSSLPSNTYAKAFIRAYARFLRLPEAEVMSRYHIEGEYQAKKSKSEFSPKSDLSKPVFVLTSTKITSFVVGVIILVFTSYLWYQVSGFASAPTITLKNPKSQKVEVEVEAIEVEGVTDTGSAVFINQQAIGIDNKGRFVAKIHLKEGANVIEIRARNKLGKETKKLVTVISSPPNLDEMQLAEGFEGLKLVLEVAPNSAFVAISCDGKIQFRGVMLAKTRQEFYATSDVEISTANAGSVHLILNGKDLGIMGAEGKSKKIKLNKDSII